MPPDNLPSEGKPIVLDSPTKILDSEDVKDAAEHVSGWQNLALYKDVLLHISITKTGTPTDLLIKVEGTPDNGTTKTRHLKDEVGDLRFTASASENYPIHWPGEQFRVNAVGTDCDADSYFTIDAWIEAKS